MAPPLRTYSTFGLRRTLQQVRHHLSVKRRAASVVAARIDELKCHEQRIADVLGRSVDGLDIVEIGPGQQLQRARYLSINNRVTAIDLDECPTGFNPIAYLRVWQKNGFGRFAKTLGRKLLGVDRAQQHAWKQALEVESLGEVKRVQGDVCQHALGYAEFDLAASWAVFEHLPDPDAALAGIIDALRPGGALYIGVHLYTSHTGHHDIRAINGSPYDVPAWGHLRASTKDGIEPSAYLNEWRLDRWRELFERRCPGHREYLEPFDDQDWLRERYARDAGRELASYSEEELFNVTAYYLWQKPSSVALDPEHDADRLATV